MFTHTHNEKQSESPMRFTTEPHESVYLPILTSVKRNPPLADTSRGRFISSLTYENEDAVECVSLQQQRE